MASTSTSPSPSSSSSASTKCWVGTKMDDMYYGHGPWDFEVPSVTASRYHAILYKLPVALSSPPIPFCPSEVYHWNEDYVRMPYSTKNLFPVKDENGEETLKQRWEIIQVSLLQPINSSKELEIIINSYNTRLPKFLALHSFFEEIIGEDEGQQFFDSLLPGIVRLALQLPEILPGSLPLLKRGSCKSLSLSQLQIASLLANAFLCTFPWRKDNAAVYPGINFARLFAAHLREKRKQAVAEKLKCIFHYFRRVLSEKLVGVVTFERKHFPKSLLPRWDRLDNNLGNTRVHISSNGVIEDGLGLLQVDFANKNVGGGVLSYGCVQEEIRYIICPELLVSRLFTEQLDSTEALVVIGVERYSKYSGYGDLFEWSGNFQDNTPYDNYGRKRTSVVAIDALHFNKPTDQYNPSCILRELNKAYVGFHSRLESQLPAVATGNWGCGAFRGDPKLKFLIQLMACSAARRDMVYYTFGNLELRDNIHEMYLFLATNQITITQLWRYLCRFSEANLKSEHLFSYIQQAHLDSKSQLCIKDFFCFNKKKPTKDSSSTSKSDRTQSNNDADAADTVDGILNAFFDTTDSKTDENIQIDDTSPVASDCDIIESSQTDQSYHQNLFSSNSNDNDGSCGSSNCVQPKNDHIQDNVLQLMSIIDEDMVKSRNDLPKKVNNTSLLSSIDECSKRMRDIKRKVDEETEDVADNMDVDEINDNVASVRKHVPHVDVSSSTHKINETPNKRRITDYFTKIDKG